MKLQAGDRAGALAAYQESLDIRRKLAAQDPGNAQAQRDVSVSLNKLGDMKLQEGDQAGALAAYQESLDIRRKLAAQDPGNAQAQRDVSVSLEKGRRHEVAGGRRAGAARRLPGEPRHPPQARGAGPGNAQAQTDLIVGLYKVSTVADPRQARGALTEALYILEKLPQDMKLTPAVKNWSNIFRAALLKLP